MTCPYKPPHNLGTYKSIDQINSPHFDREKVKIGKYRLEECSNGTNLNLVFKTKGKLNK